MLAINCIYEDRTITVLKPALFQVECAQSAEYSVLEDTGSLYRINSGVVFFFFFDILLVPYSLY